MNIPGDDFIDYMGFRDFVMEEKIEECICAADSGKSSVSIDRDDLTDEEVRYIQKEVQRRLEK